MFELGQQVTVTDGGWTGAIERIDLELQAAYIRFPGDPCLVPYAFEAIEPARQGMFDMLTTEQLFTLHGSLAQTHRKLNRQLIDENGRAIVGPLSDLWNVISAACAEVSETMHAVYAEITRRDREAVNA